MTATAAAQPGPIVIVTWVRTLAVQPMRHPLGGSATAVTARRTVVGSGGLATVGTLKGRGTVVDVAASITVPTAIERVDSTAVPGTPFRQRPDGVRPMRGVDIVMEVIGKNRPMQIMVFST